MPRQKSEKGKPVDATGTELRSVRLELPPDIHKRLRRAAAEAETSMARLVRRLVEDFLSRPTAKKGGEK